MTIIFPVAFASSIAFAKVFTGAFLDPLLLSLPDFCDRYIYSIGIPTETSLLLLIDIDGTT